MKSISCLMVSMLTLICVHCLAQNEPNIPQVYVLECPAPLGLISSLRYEWIKAGDPIYPKKYYDPDYYLYPSQKNSWLLQKAYSTLEQYSTFNKHYEFGYGWKRKSLPTIEWRKNVRIPASAVGLPESVDSCKVLPLTARYTRFSNVYFVGDQDSYDQLDPLDRLIVDGQLLGSEPSTLQLIFSEKINSLSFQDYVAHILKHTSWKSFRYGNFELSQCEWWNPLTPKKCDKLRTPGSDDEPFAKFEKMDFYENGEIQSVDKGFGIVPFKLHQRRDGYYPPTFFCKGHLLYRPDGTLRRCGQGLITADHVEMAGQLVYLPRTGGIELSGLGLQHFEEDRSVGVIAKVSNDESKRPPIFKSHVLLTGSATQFDKDGNIYSGTFAKRRKDDTYKPESFSYLILNPDGTLRRSETAHKGEVIADVVRLFENETSGSKEFGVEDTFDVLSMKVHYAEAEPECAGFVQKKKTVIVPPGCAAAVFFHVETRAKK